MASKLRTVKADERRAVPPSLLEAVESGDVLEMLLAQRRLMAEKLVTAAENTRPQYNNELNKLHRLIADEQARRLDAASAADDLDGLVGAAEFDAQAL